MNTHLGKGTLFIFSFCLLSFVFINSSDAQESVSFPNNLNYDPFFTLELVDHDDEFYILNNAAYLSPEGALKYFVWFRRGTEKGLVEYPLELRKIKRIEFTGNYEVPPDGYTPCRILLSSDQEFDGYMDTTGYIGGVDEDFGTYAKVYLQYNGVKSIEFLHDGEYTRCPFCGSLFYNRGGDICPFDKTPLDPQNP